jgi:hypothetical protein
MIIRTLPLLGGLWVLGSACGPPLPSDSSSGSGGDSSEGGSSTAQDPGNTSLASSTAGDTTEAEPTAGVDESGTHGTTGDELACEPRVEGVSAELHLDDLVGSSFEPLVLDVSCVVSGIAAPDPLVAIALDCEDAPHVLDISDHGPLDLAVGDAVELRAHLSEPSWWQQTYVVLLRDGEVIVAGMNAGVVPEGEAGPDRPAGTFFDPLVIEVVSDVCEPDPPLEEGAEGCGDDDLCITCVRRQRLALRLTSGDESAIVFDANLVTLGGLSVVVEHALHTVEATCKLYPEGLFELVAVRTR